MNESLGFYSTVSFVHYYKIYNVTVSTVFSEYALYVCSAGGGNVGKFRSCANKLGSKIENVLIGRRKLFFFLIFISCYNLEGICDCFLNIIRGKCCAGNVLYAVYTICANRCESVKERSNILTVSFALADNDNLGDLTVLVNTNVQNKSRIKAFLFKRNNVTNKIFTVGNLVNSLYCLGSTLRKLDNLKCSVKNLSELCVRIFLAAFLAAVIGLGRNNLEGICDCFLNESGCKGCTCNVLYTVYIICTNRCKSVKKRCDILAVSFTLGINNNLCDLSILINTNGHKDLRCKALLLKLYNVANKIFTIGNLVKLLYCFGSTLRKLLGSECSVKNLLKLCVRIFLTTVIGLGRNYLEGICDCFLNESGCKSCTGNMLHTANLIFCYRSKAVDKRSDILSVCFLLTCNNNLGNSAILVNTNSHKDFRCVTLLLKSYNVTNKILAISNLIKSGYCRGRFFGKLLGSKCSVKNLS